MRRGESAALKAMKALSEQMLRKFDEFQNLVSHTEARIGANEYLCKLTSERLDSTDALVLRIYRSIKSVEDAQVRAAKRKRTKKGRWPKSRRRT